MSADDDLNDMDNMDMKCEDGVCPLPPRKPKVAVADSTGQSAPALPPPPPPQAPAIPEEKEKVKENVNVSAKPAEPVYVPRGALALLSRIPFLIDSAGRQVPVSVLSKYPIIGLYCSAAWCPPCKAFTPILADFQRKNSSEMVVIYVSCDRELREMMDNIAGKPYLAIPFQHNEVAQDLLAQLGVSGIPALHIVLNPTTTDADKNSAKDKDKVKVNAKSSEPRVVSTWGRSAVMKNPTNCIADWKNGKAGVSWAQFLKFW